jgi:DNA-binding MarR family transcriptional regulator
VSELDPVIHPPTRLRLLGIANTLAEIEFRLLRDRLEVSDSVLSKHLAALTDEGYVALRKSKVAGRQRTWVSITEAGATALENHVQALHALASGAV